MRSLPLLPGCILHNSSLNDLSYERGRQGLVVRKTNHAFRQIIPSQLLFERFNNGWAHGSESTMLGESCKTHQQPLIFVGWYAIANRFYGFRGHSRKNRPADLLQGASGWLRDARPRYSSTSRATGPAFPAGTRSSGPFFFIRNGRVPFSESSCPFPRSALSLSSSRALPTGADRPEIELCLSMLIHYPARS